MKNQIKNSASEVSAPVILPIGELFCVVQEIEKDKGITKATKDRLDANLDRFYSLAGGKDAVWVSETGQKVCNVKQQSRETVSVDALLSLGVSQATIDAAKKETFFPVFRVN